MGIKIVIPANSIEGIEHDYPNGHQNPVIEEYIWNMLIGMEHYIAGHCRSLSQEIRRMKLKWQNVLLLENLLKFGADTKYILYGRSAIKN
ncbi:hypothetical protein JTE90_000504 [Oedothorax gibbosus]|uniref:Uncharacterized protein n=1 Tax=Oedothorax gibbosus TaxID=931172 RepID=A0AAV6VWH9_9ARAC|nr:hypothetical protein JTE90_000504 [Oedothorax gibbosus]